MAIATDPDVILQEIEKSDRAANTVLLILDNQNMATLRKLANEIMLTGGREPGEVSAWRNRLASKTELTCELVCALASHGVERFRAQCSADADLLDTGSDLAEGEGEYDDQGDGDHGGAGEGSGDQESGDHGEDSQSGGEGGESDEGEPVPVPEETGAEGEAESDEEAPEQDFPDYDHDAEVQAEGEVEGDDEGPGNTCTVCEQPTDRWETSGAACYPLCDACAEEFSPEGDAEEPDPLDDGEPEPEKAEETEIERELREYQPRPDDFMEPLNDGLAAAIAHVAALLPKKSGPGALDEDRVREIAHEIAEDLDGQVSDTLRDWTREHVGGVIEQVIERALEQAGPSDDDIKAKVNEALGQKLNEAANAMAQEVAKMLESAGSKITVQIPGRPDTQIEGDQHETLPALLNLLAAGLHVMLVGPAGSGKTHGCHSAAKALGMDFYSMSVGSQTTMSSIMGYMDATGNYVRTVFRDAFEHGGVFLLDELDAGNANVLTSLNAALANGECSFPDGMVVQSPDFRCVAAANTYGNGQDRQYVGRNQLDATSLDRFATLPWNYDEKLERKLAGLDTWVDAVQAYRRAAMDLGTRHIISPRASMQGARLCLQGHFEIKTIAEMTIWKALDRASVQQIIGKAQSNGYLRNGHYEKIAAQAKKLREEEARRPKPVPAAKPVIVAKDDFFDGAEAPVAVGQ